MAMVSDEEYIRRLLNDRIEFKLYAAKQHLNKLKEIANVYDDIFKSNARLEVEIEVDCFLSQLIGAVDSLLFHINFRLDLGIPTNRISFATVQSALSAKTKNIDLLSALDGARQQGNWYDILSELSNESVHSTFLEKVITADDFRLKPRQAHFLDGEGQFEDNSFDHIVNMEVVVSYLEKSLWQVRELISSIKERETLLQ